MPAIFLATPDLPKEPLRHCSQVSDDISGATPFMQPPRQPRPHVQYCTVPGAQSIRVSTGQIDIGIDCDDTWLTNLARLQIEVVGYCTREDSVRGQSAALTTYSTVCSVGGSSTFSMLLLITFDVARVLRVCKSCATAGEVEETVGQNDWSSARPVTRMAREAQTNAPPKIEVDVFAMSYRFQSLECT